MLVDKAVDGSDEIKQVAGGSARVEVIIHVFQVALAVSSDLLQKFTALCWQVTMLT